MSYDKLKEKNLLWKILHSWHIIFVAFMGFTSWITFLYMYIKGKKTRWLIATIVYLAITIITFYNLNKFPDKANRPEYFDYLVGLYFFAWLVSIIHAIASLREFWLRSIIYEEVQQEKAMEMETEIRKDMKIGLTPIEEVLLEYKEEDKTVKLTKFILDQLPMAPEFYYYKDLSRALKRYTDDSSLELIEKVRNIVKFDDNIHKILKTAKAIDKIDSGLGIITGIKNTYEIIKKVERKRTFEADPQQAIDAGLKAIALGYMISLISETNNLETFYQIKAGQELLFYYIAIELALPFMDNFIEEGGKFIYKILQQREAEIENRFASFTDEQSYHKARDIFQKVSVQIDRIALGISHAIKPFEDQLSQKLPSILNIADSTTGSIATILDIMPVWKFLGVRLATEAAVYKALKN